MDRMLTVKEIILAESEGFKEFRYQIENKADVDVWLGDFQMYGADSLKELEVKEEGCKLFRSGRHKNDMPSVATLGNFDDCMKDAVGGMTETGDKSAADSSARIIVSDHLTVLGNEEDYCVIAFMTGRDQLFRTDISVDDKGAFVSLKSFVEFGIFLKPGQKVLTEVMRIEHTRDLNKAIEKFASDKAKLYGSRNKINPSVFCTWYYYGLTVTYEDVCTNLNRMKELQLPFDVFQVDEGWEITLGEWEPNGKFPVPMKQVADEIRQAGYRPGIWTSPFVAKETASVWDSHPEWILKDKEGSPCIFHMNDTTYYVFDITHPGTWDYFYELYNKLTFDWGYTYHKLDFTRASVIYQDGDYYDKYITLAQAYYQAVAAIRRGMGEDSYFLMCGGLYDPIIGLVDAQRTGSDVLSMWSSNINKDGKTAPYTIKQSLLRYYMNHWWNNDPDALMVRINENMERGLRLTYGLLNDEEVKTSTINQFMGGGIVCSTEPLDKISDDRLYNLRHILPVMSGKVQPLDYMSGARFPSVVRVEPASGDRVCIALINWDDYSDETVRIRLDRNTLGPCYEPDQMYVVSDFYSGQYVIGALAEAEVELGILKPHGATVVTIQPLCSEVKALVVASDGHYSMGLEIEELSVVGEELKVTYNHKFNYPVNYTVWVGSQRDAVNKTGRVVSIKANNRGLIRQSIPV